MRELCGIHTSDVRVPVASASTSQCSHTVGSHPFLSPFSLSPSLPPSLPLPLSSTLGLHPSPLFPPYPFQLSHPFLSSSALVFVAGPQHSRSFLPSAAAASRTLLQVRSLRPLNTPSGAPLSLSLPVSLPHSEWTCGTVRILTCTQRSLLTHTPAYVHCTHTCPSRLSLDDNKATLSGRRALGILSTCECIPWSGWPYPHCIQHGH